MRKHLLMDLQHNRSMLPTIDNNFHFAFLVDSPPFFYFGTTRKTSLHCGHDFTFVNCSLLRDCTIHHYITFWDICFAQLLQFQHWYIIILWFHYIIIFIEAAHHHCFLFVSTHFLLLILTSLPSLRLQGFSFCCRSRYLRNKGRFIPWRCCQFFIFLVRLLWF